jgi:SAM-dependent methyltransferase
VKRSALATARNREPLAALLREVLPASGTVLEVASGTGEHALFFAGLFPALRWQPSDPDPNALDSIRTWREEAGWANLLEPVPLDAAVEEWPVAAADAILCVNMVHISPWTATLGLLRGARRLLPPGAPLILYGPYRRAGVPTAPSNESFDASLRARDPQWGLRQLEAVVAAAYGFRLERVVEMPANNLTIVFRRS